MSSKTKASESQNDGASKKRRKLEDDNNVIRQNHDEAASSLPTNVDHRHPQDNDNDKGGGGGGGQGTESVVEQKKKVSNSNKKSKRRGMNRVKDEEVLKIRRGIQLCCKTNDLHRAWTIYQNTPDKQKIEASTYYNLLHLCSSATTTTTTTEERRLHVGTPRPTTSTSATQNKNKKNSNNKKAKKKQIKTERAEYATKTKESDDIKSGDATSGDIIDDTTSNKSSSPLMVNRTPVSDATRLEYAMILRKEMAQRQFPLANNAYTSLIRLYCQQGMWKEAHDLLEEAERVPQCKAGLRLYTPLLYAYCQRAMSSSESLSSKDDDDDGDDDDGTAYFHKALRIWIQLSKAQQRRPKGDAREPLRLSEAEYKSLLEAAIAVGASWIIPRFISDLADIVNVPSNGTTAAIVQWFQSDHATTLVSQTEEDEIKERHVIPVPLVDPSPMEPVVHPRGWEILWNVHVDTTTGILQHEAFGNARGSHNSSSKKKDEGDTTRTHDGNKKMKTNNRLWPVPLTDQAWDDMKQYNESLALGIDLTSSNPFLGGGKGKKQHLDERQRSKRQRTWNHFTEFMSRRFRCCCRFGGDNNNNQYHLDYVLDGANIGYFQQNFAGAPSHVSYEQIDIVMRHLLNNFNNADDDDDNNNNDNNTPTVLLVLHERHLQPPLMPAWARPIVERWKPYLYKTPFGANDDWFWMGAALWARRQPSSSSSPSTTSSNNNNSNNNSNGTLVITNDEMRDHDFQLPTSFFVRWKERHQVHFDFDYPHYHSRQAGGVRLVYPPAYSRRIQRVPDHHHVCGIGTNIQQQQQNEQQQKEQQQGQHEQRTMLVIPLPKHGDDRRFLDGMHVVEDNVPKEETYVCIRMK